LCRGILPQPGRRKADFVMSSIFRKFLIGLVSLAAVLAVYLFLIEPGDSTKDGSLTGARQGRSGEAAPQLPRLEPDGNDLFGDAEQGGMIGKVRVKTVEFARFTTLNKDRTVEREFGFARLLHDRGDEWEIEKPYMDIYRSGFKCHITADVGNVLVEPGVKRPAPKDTTLTDNVVIHIVPAGAGNVKESFVYLDDITFISEKSSFVTAGPVRFVSADAQMTGRGMELIYDSGTDSLEMLRIIHLDTLRIKSSSKDASLFAAEKPSASPDGGSGLSAAKKDDKGPVATAVLKEEQPPAAVAAEVPAPGRQPAQSKQTISRPRGGYYKCMFSGDVQIDSPGQIICADELFINNIFWQKTSADKTTTAEPPSETAGEQDMPEITAPASRPAAGLAEDVPVKTQQRSDNAQTADRASQEPEKSDAPAEDFADIVVTCDSGILIVPMDSDISIDRFRRVDAQIGSVDGNTLQAAQTEGKRQLYAERIDYNAPSGDIAATGSSSLIFYTADVMGGETERALVPVTVTCRKEAVFVPAENIVVFEGDCLCSMVREASGLEIKYRLAAPRIRVKPAEDKDEKLDSSSAGIEHLRAEGGIIQLDSSRWADGKLLGFTKLKARRFDYDGKEQMFLATGPDGIIAVDNSRADEPQQAESALSLRGPCFAVIQGFDTLKYLPRQNKLFADAEQRCIVVDYFPVIDGRYGEQATAGAASVQADFVQTGDGQSRLSRLRAAGGVNYEDKDKQFVGSRLFYDADKAMMTVQGDDSSPCLLNGVLVPAIEYDLNTGRIKTEITAPGSFQLKR